MISDNVRLVKDRISRACGRVGRRADDVTLVAATKYAQSSQIPELIEAGIGHVGENRVQEAARKFAEIDLSAKVVKHMIGHLQSNKVGQAVELFDLIQSVDSVKLAKEIHKQAARRDKVMNILVEVKASEEPSKYGFAPEKVLAALEDMTSLDHVRVLGLMTMAPLTDDTDRIRRCFQTVKQVFDMAGARLAGRTNVTMKYLSMGMSADYEIALEEGANMVRVGRALFEL